MSLLAVSNVDTAYGPVIVNRGVSLEVAEGEVATILGPNGAGKSTLLKAICGAVKPSAGRILVDGRDVTGEPPDRLAAAGVVMVPEGRRIFADLTVEENLRLGAYSRRDQTAVAADIERMQAVFPILARKRGAKGGTLSGGQQQMLAIARGLMARPRLLLLDEPSLGLSPLMVKEVEGVIANVRHGFGAAVLLVEQNASLAFAVAGRGYLMQSGRIVAADTIEVLRQSRLMRDLYLGEGQGAAPAPP
jgi:branched-chain amino acid transport system ATP-binding protein